MNLAAGDDSPLGRRLKALIRATGPMSVADYMAACLSDPKDGYYPNREAIGASGDFITAPEISQMFGEIVGIWCVAMHEALGIDGPFAIVELGPGRGTLMADLLRTLAVRPTVAAAARVHLVETSPRMRALQAAALEGKAAPVFHDRFEEVPAGPMLVIANEFFDALPIRQFLKMPDGWRERVIGLDDDDRLTFGVGASAPAADLLPADAADAPIGSIAEACRAGEAMMAGIAHRLLTSGGALLAFDYGRLQPGYGDTLQAVSRHGMVDPLYRPGEVDITAHVDFAALADAARREGATVSGPTTQGDFLLAMGLEARMARLARGRDQATVDGILAAAERLAGPTGMGTLFKAIAVSSGQKSPGFDS